MLEECRQHLEQHPQTIPCLMCVFSLNDFLWLGNSKVMAEANFSLMALEAGWQAEVYLKNESKPFKAQY